MRKTRMILLMLALLLLSTIGQTICYLTYHTGDTVNPFTAGEVSITVTETFTGTEKTNVMITNSGTAPAYIRVTAVPGWYDAEGNVVPVPVSGTYDCTVGADWVKQGNYYYYTSQVAPGESTPVLFDEVKPKDNLGEDYDGLSFHFDVLADAVQAEGTDDTTGADIVYMAWGVSFTGGAES